MAPLARYTTLGLGGEPGLLVEADDERDLIDAVADADARGDELLLIAGGSNLVIADEGFPGTVVLVRTTGVSVDGDLVTAAAGESWDGLVARCVEEGRGGVACLSGIPGSAGATPIQNVGAYGQEVADTIVSVRVFDRESGEIVELEPTALGFGYRSSALKRIPGRHLVLDVTFDLPRTGAPVRYGELARRLGVEPAATVAARDLRKAVLALRREKGMVLDPADPDTASAGSFFTNPVLGHDAFERLRERTRERFGEGVEPPAFATEGAADVKTSAAWLIERAGFEKGEGSSDGIAISSKHVLALTNRGGGTAAELIELAHRIADRVEELFGVRLVPEPVLAGCRW